VAIDGGATTAISCKGTAGTATKFSATGLTTASHTLAITPNGDGKLCTSGVWLKKGATSGIVVSNMGASGATSAQIKSSIAGGQWDNHAAHLVILETSMNDIAGNNLAAITTAKANLDAIIAYWRGKGASVLLLPWWQPASGWTGYAWWPEMVTAYYSLADKYNCALIDIYQAGGCCNEILNAVYSYMYDDVHGKTGGYAWVANLIRAHIVPQQ
jgi:lysophospholipase L1-like esterase